MFTNPILPGTYPDSSVCRVGEDYYLVTSTFEYFPGLPVFHSRDLVNWTPLGHAIDRPEQLDLRSVPSSGGLYAPTIRHHDDDARAWFLATRLAEPGLWPGQTEVWLREFDLATLSVMGPEHVLWRGALDGAVWAEGPHLYRVNRRYYLLAAEGGTEHNHAVSVAVSDAVCGPYRGHPGNPVLTHRHLGRDYPIVGAGHADLVETEEGEWWAVVLASRNYGGYFSNLGRETHLVRVAWEDGWPVFAPGIGRLERELDGPRAGGGVAGAAQVFASASALDARDDFDAPELGLEWSRLRTGGEHGFSLRARPGWLTLRALPTSLAGIGSPSFVGRRQQHPHVVFEALVSFAPRTQNEWAGLIVRQSEENHLVLAIAGPAADTANAVGPAGTRRIIAVSRTAGVDALLAEAVLNELSLGENGQTPPPGSDVRLTVRATAQEYSLEYDGIALATVHGGWLSSPVAGGFLGLWLGAFSTTNGGAEGPSAHIDYMDYRGRDR